MRKISAGLIALTLIAILVYLLSVHMDPSDSIQASEILENDKAEELIRENNRLKSILKGILPDSRRVLYENPYRLYKDHTVEIKTASVEKVIEKGKDIKFNVSYRIPEYLRPIYEPIWAGAYYRGWIDLEAKIKEARHRLFIFPLGLSSSYDFTGSLGFHGSPRIDAHKNINFLIYHFKVEKVTQLGHQILLVGRPRRTGVEVITVNKDALFTDKEGKGDFLIQLSTSGGYEIDFIYAKNVMKYDYLMKEIKEHSVNANPISLYIKEGLTLEELKRENKLLYEQVSKYIPILEKEIITEKKCRACPGFYKVGKVFDIVAIGKKATKIEYKLHYQNNKYRRPIYHPKWKKEAQKEWAYIPNKVCENLHRLFSITGNCDKQSDLLGKLGFFENYSPLNKEEIGLLIYNFNVNKVAKYNNQIIITGIPSRAGAKIISINRRLLLNKKSYLVQLSTPNHIEIDYDILTVE